MIRITLEAWEGWRADFTINGKQYSGRAARLGDFNPRRDWWSVYDFRHALLEAAEQAEAAAALSHICCCVPWSLYSRNVKYCRYLRSIMFLEYCSMYS